MMSQRNEQVSLFAAFLAAGVEYVVVGGVAVNAHGFVRNTRDLDVFFRPTEETACAVFRALTALGAALDGVDPTDFLSEDAHYQLNTEYGRIDLLCSIGEMSFDQAWRNRVDTEIDGVIVHFISKEDLIENKRQVGRLIDLADVEELTRLPQVTELRIPAKDS
jgi:predicted nucleotidyltransferase